jgi:hypothetical protein
MKAIGTYHHKNALRHNYWIERFQPMHRLRFYTPTPSSRKRLARLLRTIKRERLERLTVFVP